MAIRGDYRCPSLGRFSGRLWGVFHDRRHRGKIVPLDNPQLTILPQWGHGLSTVESYVRGKPCVR